MTDHIIGVDLDPQAALRAVELGIVDQTLDLKSAIAQSNLVVIAIPVDRIPRMAITILDLLAPPSAHPQGRTLPDNITVIDLGSIKGELCEKIAAHPARPLFVATHPMWGTEYSGPEAALANKGKAFRGRSVVICQKDHSLAQSVDLVENIYRNFGMSILYMDPEEHDVHAAYVSHISHITSFALALTVLEKEREDAAIFSMAGGGFESTVRLAKSSVDMWLPIFMKNKYNVLDVLRENIHQLKIFQRLIENDDQQALHDLIEKANTIKRILN
ncbi:MAG: prephenate dehydrogenase/arogenate dehydrogenase family protein, partial [Mucinivorans sp.]